jgi:hypothetical protein
MTLLVPSGLPDALHPISDVARHLNVAPKTLWNLLSLHRGVFRVARYQRFGPQRRRHRMLTTPEVEELSRMLVKEKMTSL